MKECWEIRFIDMVLNPVWKLLSSFHKWSLLSDLKLEPPIV